MSATLLVGLLLAATPEPFERPALDAFFDATLAAPLPRSPRALALEDQGLVAHREPRTGVPSFFWAMRVGERTPAWAGAGLTPVEAARRYLYEYAPLWGFEPAQLAAARLARVHDTGLGAVVVRFSREVDGVPLFRDSLQLVLTRGNGLVAATGWLSPRPRPAATFALLPETALAFAAADVGVLAPQARSLRPAGDAGAGWVDFADASQQLSQARARPVYFELPDRLEPAWHLELEGLDRQGHPQAWGLAVSAADGRVLWRKNLTERAQATYRGWADAAAPFKPFDGPHGHGGTPHPTGLFDGFQAPALAPLLVSLDLGPHPKGDAWLPAAAPTLAGNNAVAYADLSWPQGFTPDGGAGSDVAPDATAALTFDYAYDVAQAPRASPTQARAAATQAFLTVNWLHDWLYGLGFDEPKGNAQADNYGRGGRALDPVLVEALDWQFVEEAAMTTPADGKSPRLQLGDAVGKGPSWVVPDLADGGQLVAGQSNMGPQDFDLTAPLVVMADGADAGYDGCDELQAPGTLAGAIALSVGANRCPYRTIIDRAADAGAVGVVVGSANPTAGYQDYLAGPPDGVGVPVLSVSGRATTELLAVLLDGGTLPQARLLRPFAPDRPSALDATILAHEVGHLVSNRLVADSTGLTVKISRAVAEGWSDFLALLFVVREADAQVPANVNFGGVYSIGGYFAGGQRTDGTGNASHYLGVRRYPYTVDLAKNGLMFRHIADPATLPLVPGAAFNANSEVHNTGEVFALMLWEGLVGLLRATSRLPFDQATRRMGLYLLGSMQASPLNPDLLEARDALLAVAFASDPDDFVVLYEGFARRGAGPAAVAPPKSALTNVPVTEDTAATGRFLFIDGLTVTDDPQWCDRDGALDQAETGTLTVRLRNRGFNALDGLTATVTSSSTGVTLGNAGALAFPNALPYQVVTASVPISLAGVTDVRLLGFTVVARAQGAGNSGVTRQFELRANADLIASDREDFEADFDWRTGWTRGGELAPFVGFEAFFQQRRSSGIDTQLVVPNPREWADLWAVTPELKASATAPLKVAFNQRWSFETDTNNKLWDGAFLEVSTDQASWTRVPASALSVPYNGTIEPLSRNPFAGQAAYVGRSALYPAWVATTVDLGTAYAGQSVWLRFRFGSDPGFPATGWEIDDLSASGITNLPFGQVVPDRGLCVQRGPLVNAGADRAVDERSEVVLAGTATDPDGDALNTSWRQVAGPPVALAVDTFTAPEVTQDTPLEFELSATDGNFVRLDRVVLTVKNVNRAPEVTVAAVGPVHSGDAVTLAATATDPDGDAVTLAWEQTDSPLVELAGVDQAEATFTAPQVGKDTTLHFQVRVTDGTDSTRGTVEVVVQPRGCGCGASPASPLALALAAWLWARRRRPAGDPRA